MFFNSGVRGARAKDGQGSVANRELFVQKKDPVPSITSWAIQGSDDTSLDPAGGQTVVVTGTGFASGLTGIVGSTTLASVTVVSPTTATFTSTAKSAGSYTLILSNASGAAAIYVPGITYSSIPTYTTAAGSIGTNYETTAISTQVVATSDSAITYSLDTGALPSGATLYANGVITGTAPVDSSSTTYSFSIKATDAELQDVTRSFTLTINTDVVTWSSPASGTTYTLAGNTPISNVTLSATSAAGYGVTYAANALPTGLTLSSGVISGTPTVEANTTSLLTATAATTNRSAANTIYWVVMLNDQYFKYNSMLMSSTVVTNTFATDLSSNNFNITIVGDTKPSKVNPFSPGYYSAYFDGTGDWLTAPDNDVLDLGSSDFTVEGWFYQTGNLSTSGGGTGLVTKWTDASNQRGWQFAIRNAAGTVTFYYSTTGSDYPVVTFSSVTLTLNTWTHFALVRSGNTLNLYKDGALAGTSAFSSTIYNSTSPLAIGAWFGGSAGVPDTAGGNSLFQGYISNVRVVKGTAVYTAVFTPPTTPLTAIANTSLLTCQSSRFIDNSTNAFTITRNGDTLIRPFQPFTPNSSYVTYGSTYFDGTGDYLTVPSNGAFAFGTSDFTIEFWAYPTVNARQDWIDFDNGGGYRLLIYYDGTNIIYYSGGARITGSAMTLNTWQHIAVVRNSGSTKLYINGSQSGSTYTDSINFLAQPLTIAKDSAGSTYVTGYMSNIRVVKGTAVYTSAFTPSATPLTAITNTSLLTCQTTVPQTTSVFVDESGQNNSITRNGNTNIGTFSPLSGSWSNYFDGTGDYLTVPDNVALQFGTGDFTIEGWIFNSTTSEQYGYARTSNTGAGTIIGINSSGKWTAAVSTDGTTNINVSSTANASISTWTHLALTRSSTTITLWVNGSSVATNTVSGALNNPATTNYIGAAFPGVLFGTVTGYISNLRMVKGTAVYTANFTPSTTPLNSIANTSLLTCNSNSFVDYSPIRNVITKNGDAAVNKFSPFPGYITNFASYSGFFDGTGDYIQLPSNAWTTLAGTFTIEFFVNFQAAPSGSQPLTGTVSTNGAFSIYYDGTRLTPNLFGTGNIFNSTFLGSSIVLGKWYHIAVTRNSSNVMTMWADGVSVGSATTATTYSQTIWRIGESNFNCFISNFRATNTTVYTATFSPPTAPLTAISGTSVLTCQSTTFIDNSANAFTITVAGNTRPVIQNPFVNTFTSPVAYSPSTVGTSMYFDGSGDYLTCPYTASNFGSSDFTVEAWIYNTTRTDYNIILDTRSGATANPFVFGITSSGYLYYYSGTEYASSTIVSLNAWTHVSIARSGTTLKLFQNGVETLSRTDSSNLTGTSTGLVVIGVSNQNTFHFFGYISNFRIVKGTAVYTGPFVPSASPLPAVQNTTLLLSSTITPPVYDATELSDMETTGTAKLTTSNSPYYSSYSGLFDGTGDYLSLPTNTALDFSTGDFTIEAWVYPNSIAADWFIISSSGSGGLFFGYSPGYGIGWGRTAVAWDYRSTGVGGAGTWQHMAITRSGTSMKIFYNGTQVGTTQTLATAYNLGTTSTTIGSQGANYYLNGYISNLRVVKGTALYTTTFTPSTTPLTAVANTSLLTCQSNRFIDNSTNAFAITKFGDTLISALQPFGGSNLTKYSSAYFPTKTDYLGMRPQPNVITFPGDLTFECWVYPTDATISGIFSIWDSRQTGATASAMIFGLASLTSPVSGSWRMYYFNGTNYYAPGNQTVLINQWTHVAWARVSSTLTYYVNGVADGTATISGVQTGTATTNPIYIGSKDGGIGGYGTVGYIADLRITNGYARYTTTFTPPTVPLLGF